jgi:hypothetical protein
MAEAAQRKKKKKMHLDILLSVFLRTEYIIEIIKLKQYSGVAYKY